MASELANIWTIDRGIAAPKPKLFFGKKKIFRSFLVRPGEIDVISDILVQVFLADTTETFSLTIDLQIANNQPSNFLLWSEYVYNILSHMEYHRIAGECIVHVLYNQESKRDAQYFFEHCLLVHLKLLGLGSVYFNFFSGKERSIDSIKGFLLITGPLLKSFGEFYEFYVACLSESKVPLSLIVLDKSENLSKLIQFQERADKKLSKDEQLFLKAVSILHDKSTLVEALSREIKFLSDDLQAKSDHLNVLLKEVVHLDRIGAEISNPTKIREKSYTKHVISSFLYKRFGHIIKAITRQKKTF